MTEQIDRTSTENAPAIGLDYAPKTPVAVAFCDALGEALAAIETNRKCQRQGHRKWDFNLTASATTGGPLRVARREPPWS